MNSLDIKVHNNYSGSIKDLENEIDISESKWNFIFKTLSGKAETIYFNGRRINYRDNEIDKTIAALSNEVFIDEGTDHFELLFRLNPLDLSFNRNMVSKLWSYFEYPSFIFLNDKAEEGILVETCETQVYYDIMIKIIRGVTILYRSIEQDVLWIKSDQSVSDLFGK
ncbi:hypothetical protein KXQ82_19700 [Mucilaginibacter sp. HMF5004]|uniref:hypothetical protein n=1 Tax=Mucilaginibacter rivuli TaxID=2857527 RepID=UPI001C5F678B|nr:hypothetical protein [Mucilaginibacter rivuli]MBW4891959.1 hypothetical protein [Mucilaginibacter rivuli]